MSWYVSVLRNYVGFSGRARRTEFWMFILVNAIIGAMIKFIDIYFNTSVPTFIYGVAVLLPTLAVCVRRLHDTGNPGVWLLITLVPVIGPIVFVVFAVWPGTVGSNDYGPDPKSYRPTTAESPIPQGISVTDDGNPL